MEVIPTFPASPKALRLLQTFGTKYKIWGRKGCKRGTARNFLHAYPLCILAVQSYQAWRLLLQEESTTALAKDMAGCWIYCWGGGDRKQ